VTAALDIVVAVARRTWVKTLRRPVALTFSLGQPLMWMLFFGFLFARFRLAEAGEPGGGLAYLDFLAPGVCAMTVLFGASQSGIGWIRDLQTAFLPRMLNTPASAHAVLLGKLLADVVRLLLQAGVVLLLALALGARLHPAWRALPAAVLCLALFAAALAGLSNAIALKTRAAESMAAFVHLVNMPLLFTSTALVPHKQMPDWLAAVARWNPLTLAVDAWRGALLFGESPSLTRSALPMVVLAGIFYWLALVQMRRAAALY
jgi:ABC-2 type transport system permease protein